MTRTTPHGPAVVTPAVAAAVRVPEVPVPCAAPGPEAP